MLNSPCHSSFSMSGAVYLYFGYSWKNLQNPSLIFEILCLFYRISLVVSIGFLTPFLYLVMNLVHDHHAHYEWHTFAIL